MSYIPIEVIKRAMERTYASVSPPRSVSKQSASSSTKPSQVCVTQAEQETARQQRRLAGLNDQRTKLLQAYYQGAIPRRTAPMEQDQLTGQITSAEAHLSVAQQSSADVGARSIRL
ncbi:MAG TPA: hypothetical protein VIJ39_03845 [Solirubrobacteraceae bacterium]